MTDQPTRAQIDAAKAALSAASQRDRAVREALHQRQEAERLAAEELRAEASAPKPPTLADLIGHRTLGEREQALALQRSRRA